MPALTIPRIRAVRTNTEGSGLKHKAGDMLRAMQHSASNVRYLSAHIVAPAVDHEPDVIGQFGIKKNFFLCCRMNEP